MLLVILVLVFAQAAQRHLPVTAAAWTGEVSRFGLAWLTLGLAGVLITLRGHITLEVLDIVPKPQFVRFVQAFALVVTAVIAAGLAREAFALVQSQGRCDPRAAHADVLVLPPRAPGHGQHGHPIRAGGLDGAAPRAIRLRLSRRYGLVSRQGADRMSLLLLGVGIAVLLLLRVPVAFAFLGPSLAYMLLTGQSTGTSLRQVTDATQSFPLLAVPLFVFLGSLANHAGLADKLFRFALAALAKVRGNLGYVTVGGSVGFSWMSGSAVADAAALGKVKYLPCFATDTHAASPLASPRRRR